MDETFLGCLVFVGLSSGCNAPTFFKTLPMLFIASPQFITPSVDSFNYPAADGGTLQNSPVNIALCKTFLKKDSKTYGGVEYFTIAFKMLEEPVIDWNYRQREDRDADFARILSIYSNPD